VPLYSYPKQASSQQEFIVVSENASTEDAILLIGKKFDPESGTAVVCAFENQNLLSRTGMRGKEVLEVGCGSLPACFGISDNQMPTSYIATDVSNELIEAAYKVDPRPTYKVETASTSSFPLHSFDLIIMRGVLHHLPDPAAALEDLRRLLKPGGELLLYEPNLSSIPGNLMKWVLWTFFKVNMEESPYGQLSQNSIRAAVQRSGFQLADVWYSSLLAFPLTGDYGRRPILPDRAGLFRKIVAVDRFLSSILHRVPILAKWAHLRVVFLLKAP
jgi:SAM-dependent methyltransferase